MRQELTRLEFMLFIYKIQHKSLMSTSKQAFPPCMSVIITSVPMSIRSGLFVWKLDKKST